MTSAVHEDQEAIVVHDLHTTVTFRGTIPRFGREQSPVPGWVQGYHGLPGVTRSYQGLLEATRD